MPRFFMTQAPEGERIVLSGENAHHISKVLRMAQGDEIVLCDGNSVEYDCTIVEITRGQVVCSIRQKRLSAAEPSVQTTLYMALPKGDKMDLIVQKSVELGVYEIVPYLAHNCVSRPKDPEKKVQRWQKIADEAAKQSGRGCLTKVSSIVPIVEAMQRAAQAELALFPYENEEKCMLRDVLEHNKRKTISVLIGPEGGFLSKEAEMAAQCGLVSVSLGRRILRCETAPIVTLAAILYASGDM